ncbi:conserved hypothetical protein [Vibrio chagasii]|nr:conserved hypothetical protein [Vibrio chagasii]
MSQETAKFVIKEAGSEPEVFVTQSPNIMFGSRSEALEMSQTEALGAIGVLMTMQRTSSWSKVAEYTVICTNK